MLLVVARHPCSCVESLPPRRRGAGIHSQPTPSLPRRGGSRTARSPEPDNILPRRGNPLWSPVILVPASKACPREGGGQESTLNPRPVSLVGAVREPPAPPNLTTYFLVGAIPCGRPSSLFLRRKPAPAKAGAGTHGGAWLGRVPSPVLFLRRQEPTVGRGWKLGANFPTIQHEV